MNYILQNNIEAKNHFETIGVKLTPFTKTSDNTDYLCCYGMCCTEMIRIYTNRHIL